MSVFAFGAAVFIFLLAIPFVISLTLMIVFIILNKKTKNQLAQLKAGMTAVPAPAPAAQPPVQTTGADASAAFPGEGGSNA